MIIPEPTKKDIKIISNEIEESLVATVFLPLAEDRKLDWALSKDFVAGKVKVDGNRIKGKLSLKSIKYLEKKGQKYDKGYVITDPEILYFMAKEKEAYLQRRDSIIQSLKSIDEVQLGISQEPIDKMIDGVVSKAKRAVKSDLEYRSAVSDEMHDSVNQSTVSYAGLLVTKILNDMQKVTNQSDINKSIDLRFAQMKRKSYTLADDSSYYYGGKARRELYTNHGAKYFIWKTKGDSKVRPSHQELNGKEFSYENPPIVDGRQIFPSEDWGCRCVDIAVIKKEDK